MAVAKPILPKPTPAQIAAFEALQAHAGATHPALTAAQLAALAAAHPAPAVHAAPTAAQLAAFAADHPALAHIDPPHVAALIGHAPPHHG